jgi:hypothetical protein
VSARFRPGRTLRKLSYAVTLVYDGRGLFIGGRFLPSQFIVYLPLKWLATQVIRGRVRAAVPLDKPGKEADDGTNPPVAP